MIKRKTRHAIVRCTVQCVQNTTRTQSTVHLFKKQKHFYSQFLLYQLPLSISMKSANSQDSHQSCWKEFINQIHLKHFFTIFLSKLLIEMIIVVVSILHQRAWVKALRPRHDFFHVFWKEHFIANPSSRSLLVWNNNYTIKHSYYQ